jgi:3-hydroxybutyryl-CoA dehydrogenase
MTTKRLAEAPILVVGAGIMGLGIAQVAAQAGHAVMLYDSRSGAVAEALAKLTKNLETLVTKGKFSAEQVSQTLARIQAVDGLAAAASVRLAIEVIVENIDVKRGLLQQLESIVAADCVLASNTSSISITAMANGLAQPGRLVGMHFFNPVPLMKLVEVVSGLQTDPTVAQQVFDLAKSWGKVPVMARSTPGFIVNRIARPYYAEALALLQEQVTTPAILDACLRGAGFRMGPCELMDLIGLDTNFAVTQSVFAANFYDKRFVPSLLQREMVDGGLLGRKSGRGFFDYSSKTAAPACDSVARLPPPAASILRVHGSGVLADRLVTALGQSGQAFERVAASDWQGLQVDAAQLRLTDGRLAAQLGNEVAVFDLPLASATAGALAWAPAVRASEAWCVAAPAWLRWLGFVPQRIADAPGLIVARTLAMLVNEAADAVQQGVCSAEAADAAMKLGVNYPAGPFEWLAAWHSDRVMAVLDALDAHYRGERYRVSPWLRQQAWQGESGS